MVGTLSGGYREFQVYPVLAITDFFFLKMKIISQLQNKGKVFSSLVVSVHRNCSFLAQVQVCTLGLSAVGLLRMKSNALYIFSGQMVRVKPVTDS